MSAVDPRLIADVRNLGLCELLPEEAWVERSVQRGVALFPNQGLHRAAILLSSTNERAIDYLEQAPILAVAASQGSPLVRRQERYYVAKRWGSLIHRGPKLRDVMAFYGLPLPMRKISGKALAPKVARTALGLAALPSSQLSQAIPPSSVQQRALFAALLRLLGHMRFRGGITDALQAWSTRALAAHIIAGKPQRGTMVEIADFLMGSAIPQPSWQWEHVENLSVAWHRDVQAARSAKASGFDLSVALDYAPLPRLLRVEPYDCVALESGAMLRDEGRRMRHCVGSYLPDLYSGRARFYSIRLGDKALATVQLINGQNVQAKGPCNAALTADLLKVVRELERNCVKALSKPEELVA